jgi:hypothetical protein
VKQTTVVEYEWHGWRGIKRERLDLFDCKLTLGFVTLLIWRHKGSLKDHMAKVEQNIQAALAKARGDDFF